MPLGIYTKKSIKILSWLGGEVSDYKCGVFHANYYNSIEKSDFTENWDRIIKILPRIDLVYLSQQPNNFSDGTANPVITIGGEIKQYAYASKLTSNWQDYCSLKNGKTFSSLEKKFKKLSQLGVLELKIASNIEEINGVFQILVDQKTRKYNETKTSNLLCKPGIYSFYKNIVLKESQTGFCRLFYLKLDNLILATDFCLLYNNRLFSLMPSFQIEEYGKYSPGNVCLLLTLQWAIKNNVKVFDFTVGAEEHKKTWCEEELKLYTYTHSLNFKGWLYHHKIKFIERLRRFRYFYKLRNHLLNKISTSKFLNFSFKNSKCYFILPMLQYPEAFFF